MTIKARHQRLVRLRRLEKLREIGHRQAMLAAGQAEGTLAQLQHLAERTGTLAESYAARTDADDGAALAHLGAFRAGLERIARSTAGEIDTARRIADARAADVAAAERRRAAVADRIAAEAQALARVRAQAGTPLNASRNREDPASETIPMPHSRDWHGS